jgi:hypothetical protein
MTITRLTTFDISIKPISTEAQLLELYVCAREQTPAVDGSRFLDQKQERDISLTISIDGQDYFANGIFLTDQQEPNALESMIIWVTTQAPVIHYVFALYAEYNTWGVKMDVVCATPDLHGDIDEFLQLSFAGKRSLLGLL